MLEKLLDLLDRNKDSDLETTETVLSEYYSDLISLDEANSRLKLLSDKSYINKFRDNWFFILEKLSINNIIYKSNGCINFILHNITYKVQVSVLGILVEKYKPKNNLIYRKVLLLKEFELFLMKEKGVL